MAVNVDGIVEYKITATDVSGPAIDSAIAGTRRLSTAHETMASQMKSHFDTIQKHWLGFTVVAAAAMAAVSKAWNLAEIAASHNEQMQFLDGLAQKYGTSAQAIMSSIQSVSDGMISMQTIAEVSTSALAKGLNPEMIKGLADAAVTLSDVMGTTADQAFRQLSAAMETGKEKSLKLAVGVIDLKDKYGAMAEKMSETEKQTALYNIVMERTRAIQAQTGSSTKSMADEMETLKVTLADLQLTLGQGMIRAGAAAVGVFNSLAAAANFVVGGIAGLNASIAGLLSTITFGGVSEGFKALQTELIAVADVAFKQAELRATDASNSFSIMTASTEDLQKATAKQTVATVAHTQSEGDREKVLKETMKALEALSKVIEKYNEDRLKMAKDTFAESLKAENVTIEAMSISLKTYMATLNEVYAARIAGEQAVAAAIEKAGAKPADILKAQAEILKVEKEGLVERLATWKTYYEALSAQQAKATDLMKTKTSELAALEATAASQRQAAVNTRLDLQEKLLVAQGKETNSVEVNTLKQKAMEDLLYEARRTGGEAGIKMLEQYKQMAMATSDKVVEYSKVRDIWSTEYITQQKTIQTQEEGIRLKLAQTAEADRLIAREQDLINKAKEEEIRTVDTWKKQLDAAMTEAKASMAEYQAQIEKLSRTISEMDKKIALTVDTEQATAAVAAFQGVWNGIQDKTVTLTTVVNTVQGGGGGFDFGPQNADNAPPAFVEAMGDAFDMGNVIPFGNGGIFDMPTFFPMSRGIGLMGESGPEAVMPLKRGADGKLGVSASGGGIYISPGAIVINGVNKTSAQIVNEIWTPLKQKMRQESARLN